MSKIRNIVSILVFTIAVAASGAPPAVAQTVGPTAVILVHGAFADGSSWNEVIPILQAKGLKVVAVQNPLTSLAEDLAATRRAIALQTGPIVLVGHSWAALSSLKAETIIGLRLSSMSLPSRLRAENRQPNLGRTIPRQPGSQIRSLMLPVS